MPIADRISRLPVKYYQHATAVDLEKMVLTVAFFGLGTPSFLPNPQLFIN